MLSPNHLHPLLAVLITSIPVFMIVIRYNLLRGNVCSKPWAIFWSSVLPWFIVIPFQTNVCGPSFPLCPLRTILCSTRSSHVFLFNQGWLTVIMNWASLIFTSVTNLVIPFLLYLVSKRYSASAVLGLPEGVYRGSVEIAVVQPVILIILLHKRRT